MRIIKLRDKIVAHCPEYIQNTKNITFVRAQIEKGDIVMYTNRNFHEYYPNAQKHIALLMESIIMDKRYYDFILQNSNKYDLILTWSKELLDSGKDNIKLNLCGTTWLHPNYRKIYDKTKLCSLIASKKKFLPGHKLRHILISIIKQKNYPIDLYGSQFNNLPFSKESSPQSLTNGKILALKDYMFSVTIENGKVDYEFTEKLIDCFLSGTVPIYWGCPSIGKFFNINGLIIIHDIADFHDIIPTLTREKYDNMLPYIRENFEIAKSYSDFKISEEAIQSLF